MSDNVHDRHARSGFGTRTRAWCNARRDEVDNLLRIVSYELFARIVLRSPVDTGRFRANWRVTIGPNLNDDVLELDDRTGNATISKARAALADVKAGDVIQFSNPLPYGPALEYGYSAQAPSGMVRITMIEKDAIIYEVRQRLRR